MLSAMIPSRPDFRLDQAAILHSDGPKANLLRYSLWSAHAPIRKRMVQIGVEKCELVHTCKKSLRRHSRHDRAKPPVALAPDAGGQLLARRRADPEARQNGRPRCRIGHNLRKQLGPRHTTAAYRLLQCIGDR